MLTWSHPREPLNQANSQETESLGKYSCRQMQLPSSKTRVVMPPPATLQKKDMYYKKQWQCVQHLSIGFWTQWRKQHLFVTLHTGQKWNQTKQNFEVGDIVLVCNNLFKTNGQ